MESQLFCQNSLVFFDSHCHIDFAEFDDDRIEVLRRASDSGVNALLIPGVSPMQWPQAEQVSMACREAGFLSCRAIGLHPWWIDSNYANQEDLTALLTSHLNDDVVAIGECGLDALRETPMSIQVEVLWVHIQIAKDKNLPLILHCVKAHEVLLDILAKANLPMGGVVHGFGGSYETALRYWQLGFVIGVGAMATRPHTRQAKRAFTELPIEALLLETDSPDMPIWRDCEDWSKQRNEPANIQAVASALADLRGISISELAKQCRENTQKMFGV